jgi:hypothetical protein
MEKKTNAFTVDFSKHVRPQLRAGAAPFPTLADASAADTQAVL